MIHVMFTFMVAVAIYFIRVSHPISMGLILILHTMSVGVVTGIISDNFIYSYILFLVILGGVLVLFIYMTSLASNEMFSINWTDFMVGGLLFILMSMFAMGYLLPGLVDLKMFQGFSMVTSNTGVVMGLEKLYSNYSYILTLFLVLYLLYALLVCACVVGQKAGALRKFN